VHEVNRDEINRILDKINSITVYGTDYQSPRDNSVLMIKTDPDLQTAFVGVMAGLALAGTNAPVKQTQVGPVTFYSLKDQVFFAVLPGKLVAVGKSRGIVQKAADVLAGKAANLKSSKVFSEFADVKKTFFFFGVAEAFNSDAVVAPQAKLLQMADGGRVVLGEHADQLFLDLALKAKSSEIVTQMQQVVQGIIALASLGQPENKDLAQLVQAVKVSADDRIVNVSVEYPVDKVIQKLGERWWAPHLGKHQPANENGESDPPAGPPSDRDKN